MDEPELGNTDQHKRDREAYDAWKKKNTKACIILLSAMTDDVAKEFKVYGKTMNFLTALKERYGGVSLTKLRSLTIKFDTYKKCQDHSMKRHLRKMSNMITELDEADHKLTEEQKIQAIIRSLPTGWEQMKLHLTHAESVKTFRDAVHHLELEEDRQACVKVNAKVHAFSSYSARKSSNNKRKWFKWKNSAQQPKKQHTE